ncbi:MAG TPA: undecaprenyldiphospho-muramoylpentapeptide beta-N-acetylglucosaminyltransferase [Desulfarculaceae bacterium]|nr:undecaprenyldiphospho-muramoylpentapeptide beta-N-acetylglucosaminyltransferase [Desulfarculaceae bacterium]
MSVVRPAKTVLFAGGGTGGHLFPGIALAEEFQRLEPEVNIVFAGTRRGLEARVIPEIGYPLVFLEVQGLVGVRGLKRIKALANFPKAFIQALILLVRYRPALVVGLGGYASAPVLLAAMVAGLPWVLQEQNAYPGLVNRVLAPFAGAVFIAFSKARESLKSRKIYDFGNPLRLRLQEQETPVVAELPENQRVTDSSESDFNILIVGGSQGARVLNRRVPEALAILVSRYPNLKVVHQSGNADLETVKKAYAEINCQAEVTPFIENIGACYRAADLVICRAGALTLAELAELGKAAILVPFPFAAHDHQVFNARAFVEKGAAVMQIESELTAAGLSDEIENLITRPERREKMAQAAAELARPEARAQIVNHCLKLI